MEAFSLGLDCRCTCLARALLAWDFVSLSLLAWPRGTGDHLLLESAVQPEAALLGAGVALLVPPPVRLYREIKPGQEKSKVWCQGARPRHSCSYCHTYSTCSPRWHKDDEKMAVLPSSLVSSYFLHITSNNQGEH